MTTQQSAIKPSTYPASDVNGIPLPLNSTAAVSTTTISRSGSSASIKMASSTDTAQLPAAADTRKHGNVHSQCVTCLIWSRLYLSAYQFIRNSLSACS